MALGGFGMLCEALGRFVRRCRPFRALGSFGRLCEDLGGFGRVWKALGTLGSFWEALGGCDVSAIWHQGLEATTVAKVGRIF